MLRMRMLQLCMSGEKATDTDDKVYEEDTAGEEVRKNKRTKEEAGGMIGE